MSELRLLVPGVREPAEILLELARRAGYAVRVTSVYRSSTNQAKLYRQWQQGLCCPYGAAPPGQSTHERRIAFDVNASPEVLRAMGELWESWGGTWGGRFKNPDPIHFDAR